MRKWTVTGVLAVAMTVVASSPASAAPSTYVTGAVAVAAKSNHSEIKTRFQVAETKASIVNAVNGAYATTAGCTNCGAGAVSFQIIIASSTSSAVSVNARNDAKAYSYRCVECENLAAAYQFIVVDSSGQTLSPSQRQALGQIEGQVAALQKAKLPGDEVEAKVDALAGDVLSVLQASPTGNQRSLAPTTSTRSVTLDRKVQSS